MPLSVVSKRFFDLLVLEIMNFRWMYWMPNILTQIIGALGIHLSGRMNLSVNCAAGPDFGTHLHEIKPRRKNLRTNLKCFIDSISLATALLA